jgi:predicted GIY-YIG superfamily endonuclease
MNYVLYKIKSPSDKMYVGITNKFKRRMKEHLSSPYAFGCALRKYGRENFEYEFEFFDTVEDALKREAEIVNPEALLSGLYYNETVGGTLSNVLQNKNPMHCEEVVKNHPSVWRKGDKNNPILNPEIKLKMIKSQACKKVNIDGIEYYGVREAARNLNLSRQCVVYRLKSKSFPTWFYIKD